MSDALTLQPVQPAIVELWKLDLSPRGLGAPMYFCAQPNELGQHVIYNNNTHITIPIFGSGYTKSTNGSAPRPTLTVDNSNKFMQSITIGAGDLRSCIVTRTLLYAKYLDEANFAGGNKSADPSKTLSVDNFLIDRKVTHNNKMIQWELCWAIDIPNMQLPNSYALRAEFPGLARNRTS